MNDDECKKRRKSFKIERKREKYMLDNMKYAQSMECSNFTSLKNLYFPSLFECVEFLIG